MPYLTKAVVNFNDGHIIDITRARKIKVLINHKIDGNVERHNTGELLSDLLKNRVEEILSDNGTDIESLSSEQQGLYHLAFIGGNPSLPPAVVFLLGVNTGQLLETVDGITVDTIEEDLTKEDLVKEIDFATQQNKKIMDERAEELKKWILEEAPGVPD